MRRVVVINLDTDINGVAAVTRTLGAGAGGQFTRAIGVAGADTLLIHNTAKKPMTVLAGGNNVPERCTSDLWVTATNAYTGTWGSCGGVGARVLKFWDVASGVSFLDPFHVAAGTISDNEVSDDGTLLLVTAEGGGGTNGLYLYTLGDPAHPALLDFEPVSAGNGVLYARDSQFVAANGRLVRAEPGINDLLLLGFDVSANPVARTDSLLRRQGFDLGRFHRDSLNGRAMLVVGANARELRRKQVWVDAGRL